MKSRYIKAVLAPIARNSTRFLRSSEASAALEFVAVAPIYLALLLATFQVAVIFIAQAYLESVSEQGARLVLTNQTGTLTQAQFATKICSQVVALFNCSNMVVSLQQAPTSSSTMGSAMPQFDSTGKLIGTTSYSFAPAPAKMMLVVMYQWPVIGAPLGFKIGNLGNGNYLMVSTQVFQVEPPINS